MMGPVLQQLYAQTECPNYGTVTRKEDHVLAQARPDLLRSCGRPSIMCDATIRDDAGDEAAPGETGEICLRSPYVMSSYWDDDEGFSSRFFDGGWLRTGDVGYQDDDGNVYIVDRRSDMIVTGGMNVYSLEVEQALVRAPGLRSVAVIGVPHDDWGEAVHAVIVRDDRGLDEAALIAFARAGLAAYKRPKSYEFRDELPLTSYGKVDRKSLRAPYWPRGERAVH
jgi:fatty-acyl-CoA synthase/long-chain acyl-CoA synthetase